MNASRRAGVIAVLVLLVSSAFAQAAQAATTITRAELSGTQVRIEGSGATPGARMTVNGGALTGNADTTGAFKIESSNFAAPPDCLVTVSDGSTSATRTLSGCTTTQPPSSSASLSSLSISPTDVVGGDSASGTVIISATAPSGGFVVNLSSDNTTAATVPPTVTVPAGTTRANFTVTTKQVTSAQSAVIIGTVGGDFSTERHAIITAWDAFHFSHGSVSVIPGGSGAGRVTSQPAGVDCMIANGGGSGTCSAFFTVGTVVRLTAQAAAGSKFVGFNPRPGCIDASKITVARGTNHICQVGFLLK